MVIVIILTKGIHFVHKPHGQKFMTPPFPLCLFVSNSWIFDDPPLPPIGDRAVFASSLMGENGNSFLTASTSPCPVSLEFIEQKILGQMVKIHLDKNNCQTINSKAMDHSPVVNYWKKSLSFHNLLATFQT